MSNPEQPAEEPQQFASAPQETTKAPKRYPSPKQRELSDAEKAEIRARIERGEADIYVLAAEFGCTSSQIAGIKAAMHR